MSLIHTRLIDADGPKDRVPIDSQRNPLGRPERLNLLGGKVEEGEDTIACAIRELKKSRDYSPTDAPTPYCFAVQSWETSR
jgi:hypothetical protein